MELDMDRYNELVMDLCMAAVRASKGQDVFSPTDLMDDDDVQEARQELDEFLDVQEA